ncbi:Skb1 methyltransferase [Coemansia reversa NRRL 1564]|uniref:Skb1 methyltransferase n=1 Tax=Coemansia reversa (strain ATCC 12441 / NRRL 1564) TaxID=763665 RepID=A0A2G5B710_COERN|nr:Skb1 methyltransferase [Coemansia reversa NRRL 1564]|eukprot:PIA14762.1 Skb1 methyltransferase [Coemansia reversa NRRL 1564]
MTSKWAGEGDNAEALVRKEVEFGEYVGLKSVVAPAVVGGDAAASYGQLVSSLVEAPEPQTVLVRVQLEESDAWQRWNRVRLMSNSSTRLQVLLELSGKSDGDGRTVVQHWRAEPVHVVVLPARLFLQNAGGYPVLRRWDQEAMHQWMDLGVALAVQQGDDGDAEVKDCVRYLRHLAETRPTTAAHCAASDAYRDVLQAPLQPLMDQLASETYEVFEADAPKYEHYEAAMIQAIVDTAAARQDSDRQIVLVVAGAGRGPLVSRALHAARRSAADVAVVAVEKNASAVVELHRRNMSLWGGAVDVVHADMRRWAPAQRADILVSELLGSFGDNELAPECLAGALERLANVCIPRRYTAYVAPVSSSALFRSAREFGGTHALETPYVVNMHAARVLAPEQPVWEFSHMPGDNVHSQRSNTIKFRVQGPALVHGVAGFFDAELYTDVRLSICPATHTAEMHSWFPMFFPIQVPLAVADGDEVLVHMWRRSAGAKTWYEWCVDTPGGTSGLHNVNGHEFWIGH